MASKRMMRRLAALVALLGSLAMSPAAGATISSIPDGAGGQIPCTVQTGASAGQRFCAGIFTTFDGAPIDVKILIEHDLVEAFVGERAALTYRCYDAAEYEVGILVQDGNAEYEEITITK